MDNIDIGYNGPQKNAEASTTHDHTLIKTSTFTIDPGVHGYLYFLAGLFIMVAVLIGCTRFLVSRYQHPQHLPEISTFTDEESLDNDRYVLINTVTSL